MNYNKQNTGPSLKQFKVMNQLGQGSFSKVFKVMRILDQKLYALKKV